MHAHCTLCESRTFEGKGFRATLLLIIFKRTYYLQNENFYESGIEFIGQWTLVPVILGQALITE
jgi:hypothetical protein